MSRDLIEAIRSIAETDNFSVYESTICTVSDVNTTENTCTCTPIDGGAIFYNVILSVNGSKGFLLIPADGSFVVVTQISEATAFISMVSGVDQVYINGDNEEGIVTVKSLTTKLNNLENKVNTIISTFNSHVHSGVSTGGGSSAVSPTPVTGTLTPTNKEDIQNSKIKHGS